MKALHLLPVKTGRRRPTSIINRHPSQNLLPPQTHQIPQHQGSNSSPWQRNPLRSSRSSRTDRRRKLRVKELNPHDRAGKISIAVERGGEFEAPDSNLRVRKTTSEERESEKSLITSQGFLCCLSGVSVTSTMYDRAPSNQYQWFPHRLDPRTAHNRDVTRNRELCSCHDGALLPVESECWGILT